ncbi:hypothetical protein KIPB_008909, partial [Kipferlia bialata]|eukprot:g8909.t1
MTSEKKGLWVGNIGQNFTEEILITAFIPFGQIQEVEIPTIT